MTTVRIRVSVRDHTKAVLAKAKSANIESLGHAGAALRLTARRSIRNSKSYAAAGAPPHTRRGQLKAALAYAVEKALGKVVIGPRHEVVGTSARAHEFGGHYKKERYPKRPFMGAALEKLRGRLPKFWANSVR